MAMKHRLPVVGVVEAVVDGICSGCHEYDIDIRLIGIMSRIFGEATCQQELAALLARRDGITALDLAGDELGFPSSPLLNHFFLAAHATLACVLPCMPVKPLGRKVSGRRSTSWVPRVSAMG